MWLSPKPKMITKFNFGISLASIPPFPHHGLIALQSYSLRLKNSDSSYAFPLKSPTHHGMELSLCLSLLLKLRGGRPLLPIGPLLLPVIPRGRGAPVEGEWGDGAALERELVVRLLHAVSKIFLPKLVPATKHTTLGNGMVYWIKILLECAEVCIIVY